MIHIFYHRYEVGTCFKNCVCLVAHLRYVNLVLTDEILYGSALSIIPPAHAAAPGLYTLNKLTGLGSDFNFDLDLKLTSTLTSSLTM